MKETFKPIVVVKKGITYDFTGTYEVSNLGTIKSLARRDRKGELRKEKKLKYYVINRGYCYIQLTYRDERIHFPVSRIVWESFNGPIPEGMQVNHINEDKTDNRLDNLNLMTASENINWATRNERAGKNISKSKKGKRVPKLGIPVSQYDLNDNYLKTYGCAFYAAEELGDGRKSTNITACCRGRIGTAYGYKWKYN